MFMIKNYLTYIKEQNHVLDPYGEDDWDYLPPVLEISGELKKPFDQIKSLDCTGRDLTDLEGIEKLVNLEYLFCYDNQLTSLKGIENLVNINWINCSNNRLTNLEGIENLVNLRELYCYGNQLTNINGIENLVKLNELSCSNNRFSIDYKNYLRKYCKKRNIGVVSI